MQSIINQFSSKLLQPLLRIKNQQLNSQVEQRQIFHLYRELATSGLNSSDFSDKGFRVYSQSDEDGLLLYIFSLIGTTNKLCVDLASGHPVGSNTTNLIVNWGWYGLLIEGNQRLVDISRKFYLKHPDTHIFPPINLQAWVTAENINQILKQNGMEGEIDFLSLDVDGIDYWIWKSLDVVKPRVVVVEYQDVWGADKAMTVPYRPDFNRFEVDPNFFGASLLAFVKLASAKGYRLVGCNQYGYNAFFVANGLGDDLLPEVSVQSCLTHPKVLQGQKERLPAVEKLPWIEV